MKKIIEGETEAAFMKRCIEEEQMYDGRSEADAVPVCYYYWQSQSNTEIQNPNDPELTINKYAAYLKGYNYKKQ